MKKKVVLYSLSTCPACKRTKEYLDGKEISYEYVEVDKLPDSEQWIMTKEIKKYNPDLTFPTIVIYQTIIGFDESGLKEALKINN